MPPNNPMTAHVYMFSFLSRINANKHCVTNRLGINHNGGFPGIVPPSIKLRIGEYKYSFNDVSCSNSIHITKISCPINPYTTNGLMNFCPPYSLFHEAHNPYLMLLLCSKTMA